MQPLTTPNRYGCYNRKPFKTTMWVQDGWYPVNHTGPKSRIPRMIEIPWTGTKECVYSTSPQGQVDPRCEDCKWWQVIADNRTS